MTSKASKKQSKYFDKNPVEAALRDVADGMVKSVKDDVLEESVSSAWKQLLGGSAKEASSTEEQGTSGELKEGQEVEISKVQRKLAEKLANIEAGYDYKTEILHFERKTSQEEQGQTNARVEEILVEIKQLGKSVKELEVEVKDISMEAAPVKAGKYHQNFFEYLLTVLKNARLRVENSANWLHALTSKKDKKGYWGMAKKHGTSYTLSADRVVAQQVG